jgi:serine/threonine protein kinase/tetratricopeptide (TPR) repeat protein
MNEKPNSEETPTAHPFSTSLTPERWQRIKQVFDQVIEVEPGRRGELLDAACADDAEMRAEVEGLLRGHDQASSFIEQPAVARAKLFADEDELIGQQIGPYKVLSEIGRGGMGRVYLAARDDGEFNQRVALKVIASGAGSEEIIRRFRQERQILAALNHPNIARLLDGGTTEDGRPYFVMEHIEGQPIDKYCDRARLNTVERLRLFRTVCAAVEHAHSYMIVHRDLKPGNILVTADGVVKLLDFGIAKLLNPELSDLPLFPTDSDARLMTPEYASPEQVRGETITRASDVYSLGVILYELLTGHRPYRLKNRLIQEIVRVICEEEPERPSTAISRVEELATGEGVVTVTPESVSRTREGQPDKLRRRLRGDLDNIVLMALRKEPQRRYGSAEQFSEDLRRSLEGEPVVARKDTFAYRSAKFVRRHKAGVAAAIAILLTLVAGIIATTRQARIAERHFGEVRQLANKFLFTFDGAIEKLQGATPARRLIVSTALDYLDRLSRDASGDAELLGELAAAYVKVGDLQGNPYFPNIGDLTGAEKSYRRALEIRLDLAARAGNNLESRRDLAESYDRIGDVLYNRNELLEAEKVYRQSLEIRQAWVDAGHTDKDSRHDLAKSLDKIGSVKYWLGDNAGARDWYQKSLRLRESLAAEFPQDYIFARGLCASHINIGDSYVQQDELGPGIASYEQARQIAEGWVKSDPANGQAQRDLGLSHSKLGEALAWANKPSESLAHHRQALSVRQKLSASDPSNKQARRDMAISHTFLGMLLAANKRLPEGQAEVRQSVAIFEELRRADATNSTAADDLIVAYNRLGRLLVATDPEAGLESFRQSLALGEERAAKDPNDTSPLRGLASTTQFLAENCARLAADKKTSSTLRAERWQEAIGYFRRHLEIALSLKQRGALSETEAASIEKVRGQLAECEAELAKLQAKGK